MKYYVDIRVGCVAVCENISDKPAGLHQDMDHVIKYWHGVDTNNGWEISQEFIDEAQELCHELNERDKNTKHLNKYDRNRKVGEEASKTYLDNIDSGFFDDYMQGEIGLDIGGVGYLTGTTSILETARIIDLDTEGYDGITLPYENASVDYIFSSHCLEHIPTSNVLNVLRDWYRVLKIDSCMVISVPSMYRYEKQLIDPENGRKSRYNEDHHRGYTPAKLLTEIESAFEPNSYVVELCRDHYKGWDQNTPPEEHSGGQYEVLVVVRKCGKPDWRVE